MLGSLDFPTIVGLLQDFVKLHQANQEYGPIITQLEKETRFPNLEEYLCLELLRADGNVEFVAEQLAFYEPVRPELNQEQHAWGLQTCPNQDGRGVGTESVTRTNKRSGIIAFLGAA